MYKLDLRSFVFILLCFVLFICRHVTLVHLFFQCYMRFCCTDMLELIYLFFFGRTLRLPLVLFCFFIRCFYFWCMSSCAYTSEFLRLGWLCRSAVIGLHSRCINFAAVVRIPSKSLNQLNLDPHTGNVICKHMDILTFCQSTTWQKILVIFGFLLLVDLCIFLYLLSVCLFFISFAHFLLDLWCFPSLICSS